MNYKIAVYTHDTFGLGHVRRCLHIIKELAEAYPESSILLITGSPALEFFKDLPQNVDIMKIPTLVKTGSAGSKPPHLKIPLKELQQLRAAILLETLKTYRPDLFLVDNFPLGAKKELLEPLKELKKQGCRTVVGLRDIVNDPETIKQEWQKNGIYEVLETLYDKILIYGKKEIFDAVKEYALSETVAKKSAFTGYVTKVQKPKSKEEILSQFSLNSPWILATGGGGGDAYFLFDVLLDTLKTFPVGCLMVLGPLMGKEDRELLKKKGENIPHLQILDYLPELARYLAASDAVVSMCGYNSASEIVSQGAKAVVVPRTWRFGEHRNKESASEELEQIFRAKMLQKAELAVFIDHQNLNPTTLKEAIETAMKMPRKQGSELTLHGLKSAAKEIGGLLQTP